MFVITKSLFLRHYSQAEFDDMPLPVSRSNNGYPFDDKSSQHNHQPPRGGPPVAKRPFLQRKTSPTKLRNQSSSRSTKSRTSTTSMSNGDRGSKSQFASRSPPTKPRNSRSNPNTAGGKVSSKMAASRTPSIPRSTRSSSSSLFAKNSSIHKSTPNLASNTKTPNSNITRSSSQGRNADDVISTTSAAAASNLIDAVPEIPAKSKIARTPPQMTRKMMAVSSENVAMDKPKTPSSTSEIAASTTSRLRRPSQNHSKVAGEKQPEATPIMVDPTTAINNGAAVNHSQDTNATEAAISEDELPVEPLMPAAGIPTLASSGSGLPGTATSTVSSAVSVNHLNTLPLKTHTNLKSPLDGHNLNPFHKPEEFLQRTLDSLSHPDWEQNINGMASVVRLARHHPEYLLVEYKPLLHNVMKHVKNLRSQVKIILKNVIISIFHERNYKHFSILHISLGNMLMFYVSVAYLEIVSNFKNDLPLKILQFY